MPMTLEKYAEFLTTRTDLNWPIAPPIHAPKARPHLVRMPDVRALAWNLYGTLVHIAGGELKFESPQKFVMEIALEKTVQEFKMWGSMSRKPGQPSEYMGQMYDKIVGDLRLVSSPGEKFPELLSEKVWDAVIKKLQQKDYKYDAGHYGSIGDYTRKIAYFFHASLQGTACHLGAGDALEAVRDLGLKQGLIADAQCFSLIQLQRGLAEQHCAQKVDALFDRPLLALSFEQGGRKPSERLFKHFVTGLAKFRLRPDQVLHIGTRPALDIAPAKKLGMRTALFAGCKESLQATPEQMKDPATKPDVLMTDLSQIRDIVGE